MYFINIKNAFLNAFSARTFVELIWPWHTHDFQPPLYLWNIVDRVHNTKPSINQWLSFLIYFYFQKCIICENFRSFQLKRKVIPNFLYYCLQSVKLVHRIHTSWLDTFYARKHSVGVNCLIILVKNKDFKPMVSSVLDYPIVCSLLDRNGYPCIGRPRNQCSPENTLAYDCYYKFRKEQVRTMSKN